MFVALLLLCTQDPDPTKVLRAVQKDGVRELYAGKRLAQIEVPASSITCVRHYTNDPHWCAVHVGERIYIIDEPGQHVWTRVAARLGKNGAAPLRFHIRGDNRDPYLPKTVQNK